tara:strand:- start:389 stop:751 length:363 start_codon:yes stop_codon:yes gene_type:complete
MFQFIPVFIGLLAGFSSGLLGIGGSVIIVPLLGFFLTFSQHQAQAVALSVLLIPIGIFAGWISYFKAGHVNWIVTGLVLVGFVVGAFFGGQLGVSLDAKLLKKCFAGFMLVLALYMLLKF